MNTLLRVAAVVIVLGCGREVERVASNNAPQPQRPKAVPAVPVMRVGGEVKAPVIVRRTEIDFAACKDERIPFMVLESTIDEKGKLGAIKFLRPVSPCIEKVVTESMATSQWRPGTYRGKPVPVIYTMTINVHYR